MFGAVNAVTIILNGLTLALALGFLLIILWHDPRKRSNQFFALFLLMATVWNGGSLVVQALFALGFGEAFFLSALAVMELGFIGASVALYMLVTQLSGVHSKWWRILAAASFTLVGLYQVFLIVNTTNIDLETFMLQSYTFPRLLGVYCLGFNSVTLFVLWRYRKTVRSQYLLIGILTFITGQLVTFLNPEIGIVSLAINISSIGALITSVGILRQEIIKPLAERGTQVSTMHKVSLAITSQLSLDTVLKEIAVQAAQWLRADGSAIYLRDDDTLELVSLSNLPEQVWGWRLSVGEGAAGTVAASQKSLLIENYSRDWNGAVDLPLAHVTFGSLVCVPLIFGHEVIGVLMVVAGRQGRLFNRDDVYLLELLGSQAAVAIRQSRIFTEQRQLAQQYDDSRRQLETLLNSTENPVIAVSRSFRLIFANPAAHKLFALDGKVQQRVITEVLPPHALPPNLRQALREMRGTGGYVYEISLDDKVYLCHLAGIGYPEWTGWVAVLNDITQLKELDRLKSEMVRMVSHDLKNPLMGAMLHLDIAKESASAGMIEPLTIIERQLERMNRIIRGVLDLEQIKHGAKLNDFCDARQMIELTARELWRLASDKRIDLKTDIADDEKLYFIGDSEQFERALINLVENALKFTGEGGKVTVSAYQQDQEVVFKICDTGVGIPEALQQQVFERFFRGRQQGFEHVTGSGLGLSIVKTIIENHKGHIWLESAEGQGTTFYVSIPLATESQSTMSLKFV